MSVQPPQEGCSRTGTAVRFGQEGHRGAGTAVQPQEGCSRTGTAVRRRKDAAGADAQRTVSRLRCAADRPEQKERGINMEKGYKARKSVGAFNIVFGILTIVGGTLMGAFLIANGGKLLHRKKDITF